MAGNKSDTRHLNIGKTETATPQRGTGPLDFLVPWVIELRITGTAQVLQVQVEELMSIGRSDKNQTNKPDVDLSDYNAHYLGVSRHHANLTARNSRVTIRDLGSSNGTYLNGGRLEAEKDYRLRHGDFLTLGKLEMQVSFVVMPSSYEKHAHPYADVTIPEIGSGQQVLLLEDDERVSQTISYVLEKAGFTVVSASTVTDALSMVEENMPGAIVMELMLPDRSGLELVEYIRNREDGEDVPLIVVSGVAGGYQMGQAIEAGVDVFLSKPVGIDEFIRGITKLVPQMGN